MTVEYFGAYEGNNYLLVVLYSYEGVNRRKVCEIFNYEFDGIKKLNEMFAIVHILNSHAIHTYVPGSRLVWSTMQNSSYQCFQI